MTEIRHCPQCGAELPPDAPEGVCPKCVLGLGFASSQGSSAGAQLQSSAAKYEQIHGLQTVAPSSEQGGEGGPSAVAPDAGPAGTGAYRGSFTAPAPEELAKHFPQLKIIELLGQGGMGAVYKAREPALDRLVAVKILPPEAARDPAFAERFHREARALAKLNHPNIVAVYGIGQAEGLYYFIMEFVDGLNLRQLIRSGQCQPEQALRIVPQICEALQFAHDEGIVHRDIKPENILLDKRGRLKIADFGLARLLGSPRTDYTLTGPQQVMGTPNYMAPEQMDDPLRVDHRADIYSLGVVFYEMLTGELPRGRFAPPSQKVQVDVRLDEVVLRALEQQPERRYQHASEVKTDVETISRSPRPASPESAKELTTPVPAQPAPLADSGPTAQPGKFRLATLFWFLLGIVLFAIAGFMIDKNEGGSPGPRFIHGAIGFWLIAGIGGWLGELIRWRMAGSSPAAQAEKQAEKFRLATLFWFLLGTVLFAIAGFMSDKTAGGSPGLDLIIGFWLIAGIGGWLGQLIQWRLSEQRLSERGKSRQEDVLDSSNPRRHEATSSVTALDAASTGAPGTMLDEGSMPGGWLVVQGPADGLILAGCAAFLTALGVGLWLWSKWDEGILSELAKGNLVGMALADAVYALVMITAGVLMRRLSARLFTLVCVVIAGLFVPAVFALNVVMELKNIPQWPVVIPMWLGMPVAIWATVVLFRPDVRAAFQDQGTLRAAAGKSQEALDSRSAWERMGWPTRMFIVVSIVVAGFLGKKLFLPDISEALWTVLLVMSVAAFLVDVVMHPGKRQGLQALFVLLCGLVAVLIYLLTTSESLLRWLYDLTGSPKGKDDVVAARVILLLIVAWLVYLMVQVKRKIRRDSGSAAAEARP